MVIKWPRCVRQGSWERSGQHSANSYISHQSCQIQRLDEDTYSIVVYSGHSDGCPSRNVTEVKSLDLWNGLAEPFGRLPNGAGKYDSNHKAA